MHKNRLKKIQVLHPSPPKKVKIPIFNPVQLSLIEEDLRTVSFKQTHSTNVFQQLHYIKGKNVCTEKLLKNVTRQILHLLILDA